MIDTTLARTMARYDRWQNRSVIAAAATLTDEERWKDQGAFFRSIAQTLNHILWNHRIWLARQSGDGAKVNEIGALHPYTEAPHDWAEYKRERAALDDEISAWVNGLTEVDIKSTVRWKRGETEVETDFGFNLVHMFNYSTHHRGQVHAMLTATGIDPGSTDLPMLPDDI